MKRILLALSVLLISGCSNPFLNVGGASGSLDDNYVEEPLESPFDKYASILDASNMAMIFLKEEKPESLYRELFSDHLSSKLTAEDFSANIDGFIRQAGEISEFKNLQWAFFPKEDDGKHILRSIKIGKHENAYVAYVFVFSEEDEYKKIFQFQVIPLEGKSLKKVIAG